MLAHTYGDAAAIAEITTTQQLLLAQPVPDLLLSRAAPDLLAIARLAVHRISIYDRNANLPPALSAAWAITGHPERAEALARTMTDPGNRAKALAGIAQAVAGAGDIERAKTLDGQAEAVVQAITNDGDQVEVLAGFAQRAADAGDVERARTMARLAESMAHAIDHPATQAKALAQVAQAAGGVGDLDWVRTLAGQAETAAQGVTDSGNQASALAERGAIGSWCGRPRQGRGDGPGNHRPVRAV